MTVVHDPTLIVVSHFSFFIIAPAIRLRPGSGRLVPQLAIAIRRSGIESLANRGFGFSALCSGGETLRSNRFYLHF